MFYPHSREVSSLSTLVSPYVNFASTKATDIRKDKTGKKNKLKLIQRATACEGHWTVVPDGGGARKGPLGNKIAIHCRRRTSVRMRFDNRKGNNDFNTGMMRGGGAEAAKKPEGREVNRLNKWVLPNGDIITRLLPAKINSSVVADLISVRSKYDFAVPVGLAGKRIIFKTHLHTD